MPLGDQRNSTTLSFCKLGQQVGQIGTRLDGPKVAASAGGQPVAELVDGPQVDARRVEREAVAVVDAGVLAEAMQEHNRGPRVGSGPVAVVGAALGVVDKRHVLTAAGAVPVAQALSGGRLSVEPSHKHSE